MNWVRRRCWSVALSALVCGSAWAEPAVESPLGEPSKLPRAAVFVQPLGTPAAALFFNSALASAGAQVAITGDISLTFDASFVYSPGLTPGPGEDFRGATSVTLSAGPTFRLLGEGLTGLFVTPKLMATTSANSRRPGGHLQVVRWQSGELGVGADVAVQKTWGHFFLGAALGAGVGYGFNAQAFSTFGGAPIWDSAPPVNEGGHVTLSLNLHLLRVGFAF